MVVVAVEDGGGGGGGDEQFSTGARYLNGIVAAICEPYLTLALTHKPAFCIRINPKAFTSASLSESR